MKWQKARILEQPVIDERGTLLPKELCFLWVRAQPPRKLRTDAVFTHEVNDRPAYDTNVIAPESRRIPWLAIDANKVELLGGPDAFAEDVPLITWEAFLRGES